MTSINKILRASTAFCMWPIRSPETNCLYKEGHISSFRCIDGFYHPCRLQVSRYFSTRRAKRCQYQYTTRKSLAELADFVGNRANPQSVVHLAPKRCRARISLSPGEVSTDIWLLWESLLTHHTQQAGGHRFSNAVGSHAGVGAVVLQCEVSQEQRSVPQRTSTGAQRTLLVVPAHCWLRDTCSETNVKSLSINQFTLKSGADTNHHFL